ncbi:MAG: hypothetical protein WDN49_06975 [Acetobacteraceae bacterium]
MLDFYLSEGIEDVCFNVEESEGDHVSGLFSATDAQGRFRRFLDRFWTLSRQTRRIHFIREIDGMLPKVFRPDKTVMNNVQAEPFGMLNVDCHGNVSSFSPELLGYKHADYNDFIIGNINVDSLDAMRRSAPMVAMTPRHRGRVGSLPAGLRVFLGLRRRRAREQARGECQLPQQPHGILQPHADGPRSTSSSMRSIGWSRAWAMKARHPHGALCPMQARGARQE